METTVAGAPVSYAERGRGIPILALHGAGSDHREAMATLEPVLAAAPPGYRRIYPDLPGMGHTPATEALAGNDDVVDLLAGFVDAVIGSQRYLVAGHSYGAYLARGLADACPDRVAGLALIAPIGEHTGDVPDHRVLTETVTSYGDLPEELAQDYRGYFVQQTPETLERYRRHVEPARALVDHDGLARIAAGWRLRDRAGAPDDRPVLILTGRQDSTTGYADAWNLLARYPRATFAVLDGAGHALLHERPTPAAALLTDWLARCEP